MPNDELDKMVEAFRIAIREEHKDFYIARDAHYLDHRQIEYCREHIDEMKANHDFVKGVRAGIETMKTTSVRVGITAVLAFVGGAVVFFIRSIFKE